MSYAGKGRSAVFSTALPGVPWRPVIDHDHHLRDGYRIRRPVTTRAGGFVSVFMPTSRERFYLGQAQAALSAHFHVASVVLSVRPVGLEPTAMWLKQPALPVELQAHTYQRGVRPPSSVSVRDRRSVLIYTGCRPQTRFPWRYPEPQSTSG